jgi:hypothetical protein
MIEFGEKIFMWFWLICISIVGAIIALLTKVDFNELSKKEKVKKIVAGVLASVFVAYIVFEMTLYFIGSERLAVACAGIASYMGTDALVALGNALLTLVRNKHA